MSLVLMFMFSEIKEKINKRTGDIVWAEITWKVAGKADSSRRRTRDPGTNHHSSDRLRSSRFLYILCRIRTSTTQLCIMAIASGQGGPREAAEGLLGTIQGCRKS
ncbi:hypothetical protein E2C01_009226 [Portunus trituberculatus]|uniref:Uncharacterized protein n=1 Tax=Portunus trituberculatus TaxID=210409 RepID=A0A5B7D2X3_PORTR|nr:hypothetical protein [Portunus trituberculatus]